MKRTKLYLTILMFISTLQCFADETGLCYAERLDGEPVFFIPDVDAMFPGEEKALFEYFNKNLKSADINVGSVAFSFIVKKNGDLTDVRMCNGKDEVLHDKIIALAQKMPKWRPAYYCGEAVNSKRRVSLYFTNDSSNCVLEAIYIGMFKPISYDFFYGDSYLNTNFDSIKTPQDKDCLKKKEKDWFYSGGASLYFEGGLKGIENYIARRVKLPTNLTDSYSALFEAYIRHDGTVRSVEKLSDRVHPLDEQIISAIKAMPKWRPAMYDCRPYDSKYIIPVYFPASNASIDSCKYDKVYCYLEDKDKRPIFNSEEGIRAPFKYIYRNIRWTERMDDMQGSVTCEFTIMKDGRIEDITVNRRSSNAVLEAEAVRLLKNMPRWKCGIKNGKPINCRNLLTVNFEDRQKDTVVYNSDEVSIVPEFPCGQDSLMAYVANNLDLNTSLNFGVNGRVLVSFIVDTRGKINKASIEQSCGYKIVDDAILTIVKNMPRWKPALKNVKPVQCRVVLPIKNIMDDEDN